MKPPLKPGDIVEYAGASGAIYVARVTQITPKGFNVRVILLDGREGKGKKDIPVLNTQWETNCFRIRLQLIKT